MKRNMKKAAAIVMTGILAVQAAIVPMAAETAAAETETTAAETETAAAETETAAAETETTAAETETAAAETETAAAETETAVAETETAESESSVSFGAESESGSGGAVASRLEGQLKELMTELNIPENKPLLLTITGSANGSAEEPAQSLEGSSIQLLLENTGEKLVGNFDLNLMNTNIFRAFGSLSWDEAAFSLPDIDDVKYVYPMKKILDAIDVQLPDTIDISGPDVSIDEYTQVIEPYGQIVSDFMEETSETQNMQVTLTSIGKSADLTLTTWQPSGNQIGELMDRFADQIENDDKLNDIINRWADFYETMLPAADSIASSGEDLAEGAGSTDESESTDSGSSSSDSSLTKEDIVKIRSFCSTAPDAIREAEDEIVPYIQEGDITVYTGMTEDDKLALVDVQFSGVLGDALVESMSQSTDSADSTTGNADDTSGTFEINYENYDGQMCFYLGTGGEDNIFRLDSEHEAKDAEYSGQWSMEVSGTTYITGDYRIDRTRKSLLNIPYGSFSIDMMGMVSISGRTSADADGGDIHTVTVNGIDTLSGSSEVSDITINIQSSNPDESPKEPEGTSKDMSTMTSDDWDALSDKISGDIEKKSAPVIAELEPATEEDTDGSGETETAETAAGNQ